MQVPSSKILRLMDSDQPVEIRCAAALVLGELGGRDAEVSRALCEHLQDSEPALRRQVIATVGKLRVEQALPQLLERIKEGGEEAELAARAAARLGAKGTRGLQELMHRVAPGLRRYIGAALAGAGAATPDGAGVAVLLDSDPGVVEAAARSLMAQVPTMSAAAVGALADNLLHLAQDKKHPLPPPSVVAVVRLLGALDDERAAAVLWERIAAPQPPDVRVAALQGLGKWAAAPGKDQLKRLFACATDADFRVAAPALVLLNRLSADTKSLPEWLSLFDAPDVSVRLMALDKVGDRDSAAVAEALMRQLSHPDRSLRDRALGCLAKMEHGRAALTNALLEADSADRAWQLARAQAPFARSYSAELRQEIFTRACAHLEDNDRHADALLFLLREADPTELRDRLEERAVALRKKKAYDKALLYLRLLARDPAMGFPTRLELALCGLKLSGRDLAAEARANDPCLQQFSHLAAQDEGDLFGQLEKTKWLEPEELYYLGFHLAEQDSRQKKLAAKVLQLVVKRSPKSKTAQAAKSKLRSAALG
jgi:HEAT repeat protein